MFIDPLKDGVPKPEDEIVGLYVLEAGLEQPVGVFLDIYANPDLAAFLQTGTIVGISGDGAANGPDMILDAALLAPDFDPDFELPAADIIPLAIFGLF